MKKGKILFIFLFFIFCIPSIAFADTKNPTCSDIRNKYNEYMAIVDEYNSLVCDNVTDQVTFDSCVNLVNQKNSKIQDLYNFNNKNASCDIGEVDALLSENSDHCSNELSSELKDFASNVMTIFYMIAPFLLIIFGSIDFFKIVVNGDPKSIQKNRSNFLKRVIAFVLLYFTPFIVKQILSLSVYDLSGNNYVCTTEISYPLAGSSAEQKTRILYSGYYGIDNSTSYDSDAAGKLLKAADTISKSWASQGYEYFDSEGHNLVYGNIKGSINNPTKGTCCATLVAAALYKSGITSENEINSVSYNGAYGLAEMLDRKHWKIIDSYDALKPGDIVFMITDSNVDITLSNGRTYLEGHVQIYAGKNKWYNAGSDEAIRGPQPSTQSDSYARGRFSFALRAPVKENNSSNKSSNSDGSSSSSVTPSSSSGNSGASSTPTNSNTSKDTNTKDTNTSTSTNTNSTSKDTNTKDTNKKGTTSNTSKPSTSKKTSK